VYLGQMSCFWTFLLAVLSLHDTRIKLPFHFPMRLHNKVFDALCSIIISAKPTEYSITYVSSFIYSYLLASYLIPLIITNIASLIFRQQIYTYIYLM
jgi:hypothetical protein